MTVVLACDLLVHPAMAGWRSHTETDAWKLADQVRVEIYRLCSARKWLAHRDLRDQLTDAADSACSNMSEGFARSRLIKYLDGSNGPGR